MFCFYKVYGAYDMFFPRDKKPNSLDFKPWLNHDIKLWPCDIERWSRDLKSRSGDVCYDSDILRRKEKVVILQIGKHYVTWPDERNGSQSTSCFKIYSIFFSVCILKRHHYINYKIPVEILFIIHVMSPDYLISSGLC